MRAELSDLHLRLNATMIYVTHDQVEAMTMADKIVVMKDGKIQQTGSPLTLYNQPANKFVAGFIGSPPMNFLTLKVADSGGIVLQGEGFEIHPNGDHKNALKPSIGKEIFFGIRPEDLEYKKGGSDKNAIPGKITVVEPLGADTHLWVNAGSQPMVVRTEPHHEFHVGDSINFTAKMDKAQYFDRETEFSILNPPA
jgi:multiple sugar transport system ATP-binding protein